MLGVGVCGAVLTSVSALAVAITLHPSSRTSPTTAAARTSTQRQLSAGCG